MQVLVIGGGGREHALCWKISQSPLVSSLYCAPGNPGISKHAKCVDIQALDINGLAKFAKHQEIDLTVVGPELPLALGIVDRFIEEGLKIFGPTKAAAKIESSKIFSKDLMKKYSIPTALYSTFSDYEDAMSWVKDMKTPLVIKADGLASGKGVFICRTEREASEVLDDIMRRNVLGDSGNSVVIEEFLQDQEEASFFVFTDGKNAIPLESSQDHKALLDGDRGPNTGGMGAYSPAPVITPELYQSIMNRVMMPTIEAMRREGREYKGILYAGLMINGTDVKVLEFNCRFGDPEAQPLLMRMKSDIVPILSAIAGPTGLSGETLEWRNEASLCVVMASHGYPGPYEKGSVIKGLREADKVDDVLVFHSGTSLENGELVNSGGRVLGVTAIGDSIPKAMDLAYGVVGMIDSELLHFRTDIGKKALKYQ